MRSALSAMTNSLALAPCLMSSSDILYMAESPPMISSLDMSALMLIFLSAFQARTVAMNSAAASPASRAPASMSMGSGQGVRWIDLAPSNLA